VRFPRSYSHYRIYSMPRLSIWLPVLFLSTVIASPQQLDTRQNVVTSNATSASFPPLGQSLTSAIPDVTRQAGGPTHIPSNSTASSNATTSTQVVLVTASSIPTTTPPTSAPTPRPIDDVVVLPLQPTITPALSVAGALLMLSGIVYGLIGYKIRWLQAFLSMTLLAGTAITALVVSVMSLPVSNAVQGAYLVAIVGGGMVLGAGAGLYNKVFEGLACMLGGFCFSMWLLTLKAGGLVTKDSSKVIFIILWSVGIFALSFSKRIRLYAVIGSTAFSAGTAIVLGIDCFTLAGYKEFWLYLWGKSASIQCLKRN
jgi:hypothetical protein